MQLTAPVPTSPEREEKGGNLKLIIKVMKLTAILLTIACLQVSARSDGQVTLKVKDAPMKEVIFAIQKQTGLDVLVDQALMEKAGKITLDVSNMPVAELLNLCLKNEPLSYTIVNGRIIIRSKPTVGLQPVVISPENLPPIDVRGRVVNENGEPVVATVSVKGTNNAVTTDANGEFIIKGVEESAILVISGVSIERLEVKMNGRNNLGNIGTKMKIVEGEGVTILSNGYQIIPKERATGSFAQPDKTMFNSRIATDVISKLDGISSGLVFNATSTNGISRLSIRGRSTIDADANILIVVDNFPYDGDISNINPADVESVTILKDAAASSIWGARAGNGVVVITTKRSRLNQPFRIDITSNLTVAEKPNLFYQRNFLNSSDFIDVEQFLFDKGFYTNDLNNILDRPPVSPVVEILQQAKSGAITQPEALNRIGGLRNIDARDGLSKYFYRKAMNQQYNINVSAGSAKSSYLLSIGFDNNNRSQVGNNFNRLTINSDNIFKPIKGLELTFGVNTIFNNTTNNSVLSTLSTGGSNGKGLYPYAMFTDNNQPLAYIKDFRKSWIDTVGKGQLLDWQFFPLLEGELRTNENNVSDIRLTAGVKYSVLNGLSVEVKHQYQRGSSANEILYSPESYYARNLINSYSAITSAGVNRIIPYGGIFFKNTSEYHSDNTRIQLSYVKKWQVNELSVLSGVDIREVDTKSNGQSYYGYNDETVTYQFVRYDSLYNLYPSGSNYIPAPSPFSGTVNRYRSYFANASYSLNDRYTFSSSARFDQANLFGVKANQKSVPLWSIGSKWDIQNEKFYAVKWLPKLSLRVTYGLSGNMLKDGSAYTTAAFNNITTALQPVYATIGRPGNPTITWEKVSMLNLGLDFSANKVISGSIEYFYKKGQSIIGDEPVPSSTGFTTLTTNYADLKGRGIDVVINCNSINNSIFKLNTSLLFSYATDKVTMYLGNTRFIVGNPVQSLYALKWAGLDPLTGDPRGYLNGVISKDYAALNNLRIVDQKYMGPANPVIFGGLRNIFWFKKISLAANISYKFHYYFQRSSISYYSLFRSWNGNVDFSNRWQKPGDETITDIPSMIYPVSSAARDNFYNKSEAVVEKGDHIRLQDISLSYSIDQGSASKTFFKRIQFLVNVNNIGILWRANKYGIDPDFYQASGYVTPRSISIGIKASL